MIRSPYIYLIMLSGLVYPLLLQGCGSNEDGFVVSSPTGTFISSGRLTADPGVVEVGGTSVLTVALDTLSVCQR